MCVCVRVCVCVCVCVCVYAECARARGCERAQAAAHGSMARALLRRAGARELLVGGHLDADLRRVLGDELLRRVPAGEALGREARA